jgi:RNA polymerase sigma-70 factor (ECF subfamily)
MSGQLADNDIIERIQNGDKDAYTLLVNKYQHKVANLVSRYVKHSGDVADVTQETFIKAYRALPGFRGESAFYTWLYRIAVNTSKNYITAQVRKPQIQDIDAEETDYYQGNEALQETASPEKLLASQQMEKQLLDTIKGLPDDLRTAITLREMDGLSYEEIATIMECPVGTVRSRIFRAREALDKVIQPLLS